MKSLEFFKHTVATTLAIVLAWLLSVRPAQAGYTVTLQQVGPEVVATGSGAIDLTGLSFVGSGCCANPGLNPRGFNFLHPRSSIFTGPTSSTVDTYSGLNGPMGFGTSSVLSSASSGSGDMVGINLAGSLWVGFFYLHLNVPTGYVSGTALSDTAIYSGMTLATLGVIPGTYVWTWGTGANQNFTLKILPPGTAGSFSFSTGDPDGKIGTLSRIANPDKIQTETADDFILTENTLIKQATFTGLIPSGAPLSSITAVEVEVYHVFPLDSVNPPSGNVPMRADSPSDVAINDATSDSRAGTLMFTPTLLNSNFSVANSVVNGINKVPDQTTNGEGPVTGQEVLITVTFNPPIMLRADHYFFRPAVLLSSGDFLWLSAPPGTPFAPDLESWIRNDNLAPDWLRIGTDITLQGPFNAAFTLTGEPDADADGVPDSQDQCPNTPPNTLVNAQGCSVNPTPTPTPTPAPTSTATPSPTSVNGGGTINAPNGDSSFLFSATKGKKKWKGTFSYSDPAAGLSLRGKKLNITITGSQIHFTGTAKIAKKKVTFTVDATDNGEPGTLDTFSISVTTGYSASGNLTTGDIVIR